MKKTVTLDAEKIAAIIDRKADELGKRWEEKLSELSKPRRNPTLGTGDDDRIVTADGDTHPLQAAPRGTGRFRRLPRITPDEAKRTLVGFRALLAQDKASCVRAWGEIDGYRQLQQSDEHAAGGVLVPPGFLAQVIVELPNFTPFADPGIVRTLPMETDVVRVPRVGTKPARPKIVAEGTAFPRTAAKLGHVELIARKVGEIIPITEELIQGSSIEMFEFLAELVAEQMGDLRTALLTNGSGADEPQGIRSEGDIALNPQAGTNLIAEDIIDTFHGVKSPYRATAIWQVEDTIAKLIRKLKDNDGRFLWTDGGGLGPAQPTLLGRPVFENPEIPTNLGGGSDESEILFGSFRRGYWLGTRAGISMDSDSSGTDWEADITRLKFRERYDGKVADPKAFVRTTGVK